MMFSSSMMRSCISSTRACTNSTGRYSTSGLWSWARHSSASSDKAHPLVTGFARRASVEQRRLRLRNRLAQRTAPAGQVGVILAELVAHRVQMVLKLGRLLEEIGAVTPALGPAAEGGERAEPARALGRLGQASSSDDLITVLAGDPELDEGVLPGYPIVHPPEPFDLIDREADRDDLGLEFLDDVELERLGAVARARGPLFSHANGDG